DPELFFPVGASGPALLQIAEAKTVCRGCPVVTECLTWALESGQDAGVWGGMSEDERRALTRRNARPRARTACSTLLSPVGPAAGLHPAPGPTVVPPGARGGCSGGGPPAPGGATSPWWDQRPRPEG